MTQARSPGLPGVPSLKSEGKSEKGTPPPPGDGDSAWLGDPGQGDPPLWLVSPQVFSQWVSTARRGKGSRSPEQEKGGAGSRAKQNVCQSLPSFTVQGQKTFNPKSLPEIPATSLPHPAPR